MLRAYYQLTKPGIIRGNLITAAAGFLLASKGHIAVGLLAATLLGMALIIAAACVYNNYLDRAIDKKMDRTKQRELVSGSVTGRQALVYASLLGLLGSLVLILFTNWLTFLIGLVGFIDYVILYGIFKRRSILGTLVGSISGATPPVAGYTAVTDQLDSGACLLFLLLVCWQMPHFYAIAMYRYDDYKAAGLPVLPVARGLHRTYFEILLYILGFILAGVLLTVHGYTGFSFLAVSLLLGTGWLYLTLRGWQDKGNRQLARQLFLYSLIVILITSLTLSLNTWLP